MDVTTLISYCRNKDTTKCIISKFQWKIPKTVDLSMR